MSTPADETLPESVPETLSETFAGHRNLLFTVAYEMLGSAADAEDVLQETWLRWADVDATSVRDPRAYLVRITTNLALNRLRTLQRRRETYVGPWLPEPLLTAPDVAEDVVLADSVSMAMMLVLETLTPTERAVFVLREVFGFGYAEIADSVDKSEAACRQIASRAARHVQARRPRVSERPETSAVLEKFMAAASGGDLQGLMDVLAPDIVLLTDGGGVKQAALRPILGRDKVLRWFAGTVAKGGGGLTMEVAEVNGEQGMCIYLGGVFEGVAAARLEDGLVVELYMVRNPEKLTRLGAETPLSR